jgi:hypothetical protein
MSGRVRIRVDDKVGTPTLDHFAKRNASGAGRMQELMDALGDFEQRGVRAVVVQAAELAEVWSAGHDIDELQMHGVNGDKVAGDQTAAFAVTLLRHDVHSGDNDAEGIAAFRTSARPTSSMPWQLGPPVRVVDYPEPSPTRATTIVTVEDPDVPGTFIGGAAPVSESVPVISR